jgi:AmmeMemoRadiSam system protein B
MDQSMDASTFLGNKIAKAVKKTGKKVVVVASSDFTHCGINYGFPVPRGMNAGEFARSRDMPVIDRLLEMDIQGAFNEKRRLGTTACGLGPIAAMYTAVMEMGAQEARMLDYTTSYDVSPASSAVGYASIVLV